MFEKMTYNWRVARGTVLKRDAVDALERLKGYDAAFNAGVAVSMGRGLAQATEMTGGNLQLVSDRGARKIAKALRAEARQVYDFNMVAGLGLGLFAIWLETLVTPGDEALEVRERLRPMMDYAMELYFGVDPQDREPVAAD